VIGLDCATPQFVFGSDAFDLPDLRALCAAGCWGELRTCDPPITIPAWSCMTSGRDPGVLGCYGFRNRADYSYAGMRTANSTMVQQPRVWDILSRQGKKVVVLGVPQTYPVVPVNGWMVGDFLTPDTTADYTYPKSLKEELRNVVGDYVIDVKDFRTEDKDGLLRQLYAMLENRFAVARHLLTTKPWDFFMMVDMSIDRLHHGFWRFGDAGHPKYQPGSPYESVLRDFYRAVDAQVGGLASRVGDETAVLVVSDHGAKRMVGGFCINQWLINEGYLVLRNRLDTWRRIEDCEIDWSRTTAWASGGYYGRIFLNVAGREPEGTIRRGDYDAVRQELIVRLEALPGPDGERLGTKVRRPEDLYQTVNGVAPDLFLYAGDLNWRSVGSVGFPGVFTLENDTGPDDANHDYHGIFIMDDRSSRRGQRLRNLHIMDIAPTTLRLLGCDAPPDMQGKAIE